MRVVNVYSTSTGIAFVSSQVTPFLWLAALSAWTVTYGRWQKRKGERLAAASEAAQAAQAAQAANVHPEPTET